MKRTAALLVLAGLAVAVSAFCVWGQSDSGTVEEQVIVAAPVQQEYKRQLALAFEGGRARIGLFDDEAAMEFAERQPLAIQLERKPERIIIQAVPDSVFQRAGTGVEEPVIGDIVMDVGTKEIFICCRDMEASAGRVLLGHVISGIEPLSRMDGMFEALAMEEDL